MMIILSNLIIYDYRYASEVVSSYSFPPISMLHMMGDLSVALSAAQQPFQVGVEVEAVVAFRPARAGAAGRAHGPSVRRQLDPLGSAAHRRT